MSILQRAGEVIANAEAELRRLIGDAAEKGDYSSIEAITKWASLLGELCSNQGPPNTYEPLAHTRAVANPAPTTSKEADKRRGVRKRRSYPYFAKAGESLVKVAWSKSSKSEYQHKAPRVVAVKLAEALAQRSKGGAIIPMDKVLPLKLDDGSDIPDYQAYVSLAWLRHTGAVKQNGRQGYSIKKPNELITCVEAAWAQLVEVRPS